MKTILYIHGMGGGEDSRIPSILSEWFGMHRPDVRVIVRTYDFNPDIAAGQIDAWYDELRPDLVIGESLGSVHALALLAQRSSGADGATTVCGCKDFDPSGGMHPQTVAPPSASNALPAFPLLLVSPALNGPAFFHRIRGLVRFRWFLRFMNRWYKAREGRRQFLDFTPENMSAWGPHRAAALAAASLVRPSAPGHPGPEDAFPEGSESPQLRGQGAPAPIHAFFGRRDHYRRTGIVSLKDWRRRFGPGTWTLYDGTHFMEEEHLKALLIPAILQRI